MLKSKFNLTHFIPTHQNRDEFLEQLLHSENNIQRIGYLMIWLLSLSFLYGVIMGCYSGWLQALSAGIKLPFLFLLSFAICFPALFIIQILLGSKMTLLQMTTVILSGLVLMNAIMISFIPIVIFFILTGGNYHFLQLLHVAIFSVAGLFGMKSILDALRFSCEEKSIYPKAGMTVFRFWVVILAFVSVQLAWNLRPFLAEKDLPFALFRKYEGNCYTAVLYSFRQLSNPATTENETQPVYEKRLPFYLDTTAAPKKEKNHE